MYRLRGREVQPEKNTAGKPLGFGKPPGGALLYDPCPGVREGEPTAERPSCSVYIHTHTHTHTRTHHRRRRRADGFSVSMVITRERGRVFGSRSQGIPLPNKSQRWPRSEDPNWLIPAGTRDSPFYTHTQTNTSPAGTRTQRDLPEEGSAPLRLGSFPPPPARRTTGTHLWERAGKEPRRPARARGRRGWSPFCRTRPASLPSAQMPRRAAAGRRSIPAGPGCPARLQNSAWGKRRSVRVLPSLPRSHNAVRPDSC